MAVKTFQTRIKSKYDISSNWDSFQGLAGEILLGSDDKYIRIGNGTGWDFAKMSADNVNVSYTIGENAINTAQDVITDLNTRINNITGGSVVTSFGGKTGAITVAGPLSMNNNELTIATAADDTLGVVKVTDGNGLTLNNGTITMGLASSTTAGAMTSAHYNKLEGIDPAAQVNVIEKVQVNSVNVEPDANKVVNITIADGNENGTILVNGSHVSVYGLGSAAYTNSDDYATAEQGRKADEALQSISNGTDGDYVTTTVTEKGGGTTQTVSVSVTTKAIEDASAESNGLATANNVKAYVENKLTGIVGAMVYRGTTTSYPPVAEGAAKGDVYVASTNFETYEKGDMFIYNGASWDVVSGENQVSVVADGALLTAGAGATQIATVDGTEIKAKVEVTSGNANIAKNVDGVVTLKSGVTQNGTSGTITNNEEPDITLAKVATTGAATDISYTYGQDDLIKKDNVQEAIKVIDSQLIAQDTNIGNHTAAIEKLNGDENTEGSVAYTVTNKINTLDNTGEIIASESDGVVTLSKTIKQTDGVIDIESENNTITLAKVATTGKISNLEQEESVQDDSGLTNTVDMIIFDCGSATVNTL